MRDPKGLATWPGSPSTPNRAEAGAGSLIGGSRTAPPARTHGGRGADALPGRRAISGDTPAGADGAAQAGPGAAPPGFRCDAEAAAGAVVLAPSCWHDAHLLRPTTSDALQQAVIDAVQVRLGYERP